MLRLLTSYSNDKRKREATYWYLSQKVNLPVTFWLHFIYDRIFLRLLSTDTSDFVKRWRIMIGRQSEHQRMKRAFVKVNNGCFPIKRRVWIMLALVLCISGLLLKFVELSMFGNILFPSHRLFYIHSTRNGRYHASHAIPSTQHTEVSLHWTWFKVGNHTKKSITFTSTKKNVFFHFIK